MCANLNPAYAVYHYQVSQPDAIAVAGPRKSLTYQQLAEQASTLALSLSASRRNLGQLHEKPFRVGILASRSEAACVAVLAACWAGATYVPIGTRQPSARLRAMLEQCHFAAIITDDAGIKMLSPQVRAACPAVVLHAGRRDCVPEDHADVNAIEDLPQAGIMQPAAMAESDIAYIIFTSGTTGVPKGVMVSTRAFRHYLTTIGDYLRLRPDDRVIETCELSFDFSMHNMFSTWEAGAALHILPATMVMNAVRFVRDARITVWNSVPSLAAMLKQVKALKPASLSSLRVTVFGGEQLTATTVEAWREAAPNSRIINLYGPTEATVFCVAQTVEAPFPLVPGRDVIAIGQPLAGNSALVVDNDGNALPPGVPGELAITGIQLADGYLGALQLTNERFPTWDNKRCYRTGDLAVFGDDGLLYCLGRLDHQVKVRGHRVELEEIDTHLRLVSGSELVGSIAWPIREGMASGIVSFVVTPLLDPDALLDALQSRLPSYMLPDRIIILEQLPRNASGKVDRQALRRMLEEAP